MVSSGLVERVDVSHYRLSLHLVTAFIILSIVFWKFLKLTNLKINEITFKLNLIKFFLFLLYLQLVIGAFVSGMDAGKIYNTWPLMGASYFPDDSRFVEFFNISLFDNPSIVQFIHRNLAYLICFSFKISLPLLTKDNAIHSTSLFTQNSRSNSSFSVTIGKDIFVLGRLKPLLELISPP